MRCLWVFWSWKINRNLLYFSHVKEKELTSQFFFQDILIPLSQSNVRKPWPVFFETDCIGQDFVSLNMWKQPILSLERRKSKAQASRYLPRPLLTVACPSYNTQLWCTSRRKPFLTNPTQSEIDIQSCQDQVQSPSFTTKSLFIYLFYPIGFHKHFRCFQKRIQTIKLNRISNKKK